MGWVIHLRLSQLIVTKTRRSCLWYFSGVCDFLVKINIWKLKGWSNMFWMPLQAILWQILNCSSSAIFLRLSVCAIFLRFLQLCHNYQSTCGAIKVKVAISWFQILDSDNTPCPPDQNARALIIGRALIVVLIYVIFITQGSDWVTRPLITPTNAAYD